MALEHRAYGRRPALAHARDDEGGELPDLASVGAVARLAEVGQGNGERVDGGGGGNGIIDHGFLLLSFSFNLKIWLKR